MDNSLLMKKAAGSHAVEWIEEGMVVGLGTGSTASCFIDALIQKCQKGLSIQAIATSKESEEQARAGAIPILNIQEITSIDITVDGADEIDPQKTMIKGGGGALLREKIIASMSKEMVVIIDESKQVSQLGNFGVPIEVVPFAISSTLNKLEEKGFKGKLRKDPQGSLFMTDNGNYIFDIHYSNLCSSPEEDHLTLIQIPAVIETGFFINLAGRVIVGKNSGGVFLIQ